MGLSAGLTFDIRLTQVKLQPDPGTLLSRWWGLCQNTKKQNHSGLERPETSLDQPCPKFSFSQGVGLVRGIDNIPETLYPIVHFLIKNTWSSPTWPKFFGILDML